MGSVGKMSSVNRVIVAMLVVSALAIAFWVLALGPKREEASKLGTQVGSLKDSLAVAQQQVEEGLAARRDFDSDYSQLVVLGKAVPAEDETASLLVQIDHIAEDAKVRFAEIKLRSEGGESAPLPTEGGEAAAALGTSTIAAPTEAAAASTPLGASIGPAGLGAMPYSLKFTGDFAHVADFIHGLDRLVKTTNSKVAVDGRLVTIDGFSLGPNQNQTFPALEANFAITTYLTPAGQGVTSGVTPVEPGSAEGTPAAAVTEGAP